MRYTSCKKTKLRKCSLFCYHVISIPNPHDCKTVSYSEEKHKYIFLKLNFKENIWMYNKVSGECWKLLNEEPGSLYDCQCRGYD